MKVESSNDMEQIQRLDPSRIGPVEAPTPAKGSEDIALIFSQDVAADANAFPKRFMPIRVPPVEQLAQLYDMLGHPAQASLAVVARRMRIQLLQQPALDKLLDLGGGDPARTFVVLKQVAAQAQDETRSAQAALARDAIARLEMRFKREIQAGLNIAAALQRATDDPQERQAIRTLYYASVVTRQSLSTMMHALLGMYGGERFVDGLNVMRRALADDVAAHAPSVPDVRLRALLRGLQSCGQLGAVLANCRALILRLGAQEEPVGLLQRLLGYAGSGIESAEVQRLAYDLGGDLSVDQLVCLNSLYPVIQRLPLALWDDSRSRQEALRSFLLVMDEFARVERGRLKFFDKTRVDG